MCEGGRKGRKQGKGREAGKSGTKAVKGRKKGIEEHKRGNKERSKREKREEGKKFKKPGVLSFRDQRNHRPSFCNRVYFCFASCFSFRRIVLNHGADNSDCKTAFAEENLTFHGVQDEAVPTAITEFVCSRTDQENGFLFEMPRFMLSSN